MNSYFLSVKKYKPVAWLGIIALGIFFITRFFLLVSFKTNYKMGALNMLGSFAIGVLYDLVIAACICLPLVLLIMFTNHYIYSKKGKWLAIGGFAIIFFILFFTTLIPKEFNKDLYKGLIAFIILRFFIYIFLLNKSELFRDKWRSTVIKLFIFIIIFALLFNAVSEWFFWNEFSARYNFIAVDYLIYTNEVLGNIKESYPINWIMLLLFMVAAAIFFPLRKKLFAVNPKAAFFPSFIIGLLLMVIGILFTNFLSADLKNFSKNNYANELAGNGIYEFAQAFKNNELNFTSYYKTIDVKEAFEIVRNQLSGPHVQFLNKDSFSIERKISYPAPELKKNIVLISVESLSATFLGHFGNTEGLTPYLDSLADEGMLFTNLYASGTRTVRGLEALALCIPPTPGQSLVKRPGNENLFSFGSVLKGKGYNCKYIYGGYGYFDNMNYFFSNNSYRVVDRSALKPEEIHYANIWGVADEDIFTLALSNMDEDAAKGVPFFTQVMTVSNHRPYSYPENRIDIPPSKRSRQGAVKYTDYAIRNFIKNASKKSWFANTIFVIVADHCASSAGGTALPVTGYQIPLIIYSPGFIPKENVTALTAQIDIGPTLLGLLHVNYVSKFFGIDVLNTATEKQRAFISTYQGLGFIKNDNLVVQLPVKKVATYKPNFNTGDNTLIPVTDSLEKQAIAWYQVAAWYISNNKYGAEKL